MKTIANYIEKYRISDYLLMLLILTFAIENRLMPILLGLLALTLVFVRKPMHQVKEHFRWNEPFIWAILLFLMHVIGVSYSDNVEEAWLDVGRKLSLLAIPLILAFSKTKWTLQQVLHIYFGALIIACVVCYANAMWISLGDPGDNQWYYFKGSYFSFMMHRSYFATYLAIGAAIAAYAGLRYTQPHRLWYFALSLVFTITNLLTLSKPGIIIQVLLFVVLSIWIANRYVKRIYALLAAGVIGLLFVGLVAFSPPLKKRFSGMFKAVSGNSQITSSGDLESSAARIYMWNNAMRVISEQPLLGVGTGDAMAALHSEEKSAESSDVPLEHKLNAHNQYMEAWVQVGVFGFLTLLAFFVTAIYQAIRRHSIPLLFMSIGFAITLLFESFFERQQGLMPVLLMVLLIASLTISTNKNQLSAE